MEGLLHFQFLVFSSLILLLLSLNVKSTHAMSTITAMARDQISCTLCSSCDNPCQPIFSPPPLPLSCPSPPLPPPPPAPAPSSDLPLSPSYGSDGGSGGDGNYYYPPTDPSVYPTPPPPNPIVPYYPFYYYNQPSFNRVISKSVQLKNHSFMSSLILVMAIFLFL
ncbi:hypothetical protein RND71_022817 [Anisodus tanguticus]|uniref:Uncharacterized protein n=1 Tax=Anisodus tanguticus TaxID=243964 RepID=A0AAE1RTN1_9SOLA|nr:hypothetical protein RND71_022817 [Anisodus tanguticus]